MRADRSSHAGAYCGPRCRERREAGDAWLRGELAAAGFAPHPTAPNLMVREGYAVSVEQCWHEGGTARAVAAYVRAKHTKLG